MKKALVFKKLAARKLVLENAKNDSLYALKRVLTEGRVNSGWRAVVTQIVEAPADVTVDTGEKAEDGTPVLQHKTQEYSFELHIQQRSKRLRREDVVEKEFHKIMELAGKSLKGKGWSVSETKDLPEDYVLPGYENADKEEDAAEAKAEKEVKDAEESKVEVEVSEAPAAEVNEPVSV